MAQEIWAETFKYMADNKVMFEGILLKPSMVTPGADGSKMLMTPGKSGCKLQTLQCKCRQSGSWADSKRFKKCIACPSEFCSALLCIAVARNKDTARKLLT